MTTEQVHEAGARRHGAEWIRANQRAVQAMNGPLRPWTPGVKETVPLIVLRILDGVRLDAGYQWLRESGEWVKGIAACAAVEGEKK